MSRRPPIELSKVPAGFWAGFWWGFTNPGLVFRQGPLVWLEWADVPDWFWWAALQGCAIWGVLMLAVHVR
jgi:hypothetical protein